MALSLLTAFALVLIFEGILPLFAQQVRRETFTKMISFNEAPVPTIGSGFLA